MSVILSPQQKAVLECLRDSPEGVTTWDLTYRTRVLTLTQRISELRDLGFRIEATRLPTKGVVVYRYRLLEPGPRQLTLDGVA